MASISEAPAAFGVAPISEATASPCSAWVCAERRSPVYVDLMFVDKHTLGLVEQEVRRADGRIPEGAADSVTKARDLSEVAERIRAAATA